jgi:hypothetical protein
MERWWWWCANFDGLFQSDTVHEAVVDDDDDDDDEGSTASAGFFFVAIAAGVECSFCFHVCCWWVFFIFESTITISNISNSRSSSNGISASMLVL